MKQVLVTQGYRLADAIAEFLSRSGTKLVVGDKFAFSISGVDGFFSRRGKPEDIMFCSAKIMIHSQIATGEVTSPRRRLPDRTKVLLPLDMCHPGNYDLVNVEVEVATTGYIIRHNRISTGQIRYEEE